MFRHVFKLCYVIITRSPCRSLEFNIVVIIIDCWIVITDYSFLLLIKIDYCVSIVLDTFVPNAFVAQFCRANIISTSSIRACNLRSINHNVQYTIINVYIKIAKTKTNSRKLLHCLLVLLLRYQRLDRIKKYCKIIN